MTRAGLATPSPSAPLRELPPSDSARFRAELRADGGIAVHRSIHSGGAALLRPRQRMVERLAQLGVTDARVLEALAAVPRHALVP